MGMGSDAWVLMLSLLGEQIHVKQLRILNLEGQITGLLLLRLSQLFVRMREC